ncbi:MAG: hypothetical protein EAZ65_02895 [Verrucomicrobia bacterium]|nr:MAG: hypothetical protein EAZ84_02295 [Verrucomicrobiota bacterium]TAE88329.1 MAG: hypothetical protein EAZ82_03580 [Verrucomicrobiota bacterium]TAF26783.1 MAG: hypothetical protein EAZ71_02890 [Verrucomicrobiota bacterium]TAF42040.1 MAG: hypothetical protein EAZ65_02895 [Verrucomicrobiota bacterium]
MFRDCRKASFGSSFGKQPATAPFVIRKPALLFAALLVAHVPLAAQDGGKLYATYCSACHGADGKGAAAGTFPPLAASPWLKGAPDRAIQVVLHGLEGPIQVLGKNYNLAMPPQGGTLPDDQIAAILSHVRKSWGNQESAVTADQVKSIRAATAARTEAWTAEALLKLHPLPLEKTALSGLTSAFHKGQWKDLPDFKKLKPESVEEEHDGILSLSDAPAKEHFGMVWEGKFDATAAGNYAFRLDADDSARLWIDGRVVAQVRGIGPIKPQRQKIGRLKLTKGLHDFRLEYVEFTGQEGLSLAWTGPGMDVWKDLSDRPSKDAKLWPEILLTPTPQETSIYRNFIAGTTARAIGIGLSGGMHFAWSADHFAPELIWTGKFLDAGRHWTERGQGNQNPAGEAVTKLGKDFALRGKDGKALPDLRFGGYQLDQIGQPTFRVRGDGFELHDAFRAEPSGMLRRIEVTGRVPDGATLTLVDGLPLVAESDGSYRLGGKLRLAAPDARKTGDRTLILPLRSGLRSEIRYLSK